MYHVEFDDNNESKIIANIIAASMYASCNKDGNEYLLMDLFIDHKSNALAVSREDQHMVQRRCNPCAALPPVGTCAYSERIALPLGRPSRI